MDDSRQDRVSGEFAHIEAQLRSARVQLTALEQDQLKRRVMSATSSPRSHRARWSQTRWVGLAAALLVAAGTTGGTLAATGGGAPQNAAIAQYSTQSCHLRWHYGNTNNTGHSWSGTGSSTCAQGSYSLSGSMEGALQMQPGQTLYAGYDITAPGVSAPGLTVTIVNPTVVFAVSCQNKQTPTQSTITISMATTQYKGVNGGAWTPSGDEASPLVYQGSIVLPALCGPTGTINLSKGGTFTATSTSP